MLIISKSWILNPVGWYFCSNSLKIEKDISFGYNIVTVSKKSLIDNNASSIDSETVWPFVTTARNSDRFFEVVNKSSS